MRSGGVALLLVLAAAPPALAQGAAAGGTRGEQPATPPLIRYGKWGAAALFAGFTSLGVIEHRRSNNAFSALQAFCRGGGACAIGPDGRYSNPAAEQRYQAVVSSDRAARAWLIGGQVALAGAAALFVVELLNERGTRNIPFQGLILEPGRHESRIGWSLPVDFP